MNRRVLLTGGSGFLGRNASEVLQDRYEVISVARRDYDLLDQRALRAMLTDLRPEVVVHLAGLVGGIGAHQARPADFCYQNLLMNTMLIHESAQARVGKLVAFLGGCSYPADAVNPIKESDLWRGYPQVESAPFSTAIRMIQVQTAAYATQYGLEAAVAVPGNVYGPHDNFDPSSSHVVAAMIRRFHDAVQEGVSCVTCWGSGRPIRDFLYVEDLMACVPFLIERYRGPEPLNIARGQATRIRELAEVTAEITGYRGEITWDKTRADGQEEKTLDTSRMRALGALLPDGFERRPQPDLSVVSGQPGSDSRTGAVKGRIVLKGPFGFVGSAFRRYLEESGIPFEVLTHENREELSTKGVELFIDAAGNSRKFLAERDPVWDRSKNVTEVADSITSFRPRCYLLVSSSAVYADTSRVSATREVADPTGRVSTYGGHKREAERLVRESGARFLILRPAGFFGPGLAKGPLYDLLERRPPRVSPRSRMQLVDVNAFARTALRLAPDGGVINAVSARPTILMEAFPEASAYQQTHFRTDTLPVLDFGLFSDRFSRVAGPQVGGSERLEGFAQNYLQKECRRAVEIMVLAGGRGSRLQLEIPKPVAPLAGRPLLRHVLDPIIDAGYSCCTLLLGSESEWVTNVITRDPVLRHARRIVEEKPLGTGGAVIHALLTSRAETVIVVNGDTIYDNFDPELLVKRHRRTGGIVTLLATRMPESGDYGGLVVGIDGRLATFAEKGGKGPCLVYAGCLVLDRRRFLEHFPLDAPCSLERDLLPALETSGQIHVYAHPDTTFVDAGTPERWHQAEAFVRQQSKHSA